MKLAGHTMGTPGRTLEEACLIFEQIGYEGIEIRCAPDGQLDTEAFDLGDAGSVKETVRRHGLEVVCLTPYFRNFIHEEKRARELASMRKVVDIAAAIDCLRVRAYGGLEPKDEGERGRYWERTVSGLAELGAYAGERGVDICVETHGGSLTMAAADTARLVAEVGLENVGILFDYPWVSLAGREGPQEAVEIVAPYVKHVHVKDWRREPDGELRTTLMGEGALEWPTVLAALVEAGYDGCLSDEYEKYWKAYLPEPEVGMLHDFRYLNETLERIGDERSAS